MSNIGLTNEDVIGIYFANSNFGVLLAQPLTGTRTAEIFKTVNGGGSWTQIPQSSVVNPVHSIYASNESDVWITGDVVLRQYNGSFWPDRLPLSSFKEIYKVSFYNDIVGVIVGEKAGQAGGLIYSSQDGGATLTKATIPSTIENLANFAFSWVAQATSSIEYATGCSGKTNGFVCKSVDGGGSWNGIALSGSGGPYVVGFPDPENGFILGDMDALYFYTTDSGASWQSATLPFAWTRTRAIHFPTAHVGWAVGNNGGIIKYAKTVSGALDPSTPQGSSHKSF